MKKPLPELNSRVVIIQNDYNDVVGLTGEIVGTTGCAFYATWIILLDEPYCGLRAIALPASYLEVIM